MSERSEDHSAPGMRCAAAKAVGVRVPAVTSRRYSSRRSAIASETAAVWSAPSASRSPLFARPFFWEASEAMTFGSSDSIRASESSCLPVRL